MQTNGSEGGTRAAGRRREFAARVAGVEPVYDTAEMTDADVVAFVRRVDLNRRNLTPSQRAAIVVALNDLMPAHRPAKGVHVNTLSLDDIATEADAAKSTVRRVAEVKAKAPEVLASVVDGKLDAHTAAKVADLSPGDRAEVVAAADPKAAAKDALAKAERAVKKLPRVELPTVGSRRSLNCPIRAVPVRDTHDHTPARCQTLAPEPRAGHHLAESATCPNRAPVRF